MSSDYDLMIRSTKRTANGINKKMKMTDLYTYLSIAILNNHTNILVQFTFLNRHYDMDGLCTGLGPMPTPFGAFELFT